MDEILIGLEDEIFDLQNIVDDKIKKYQTFKNEENQLEKNSHAANYNKDYALALATLKISDQKINKNLTKDSVFLQKIKKIQQKTQRIDQVMKEYDSKQRFVKKSIDSTELGQDMNKNSSNENMLWLEKHRPQTLDEIVGNEILLDKLKILAREGNIPNMILTGPPGCGKTTTILALCRQVLGDKMKNATIELNASNERGIDVIRTKVKEFAEKYVKLEPGQHKVIILDEADSLTTQAQQALRMIITDYSDSTRFVFSCNQSSKIIEAIQSRCAILRFNRLNDEEILANVLEICNRENVKYDKSGLEALLFIAEGDMRNVVNNLQAVQVSKGMINEQNVNEICDVPSTQDLENIYQAIKQENLNQALQIFENIWVQDYSTNDLITYMSKTLDRLEDIEYKSKFELMKNMAELRIRASQGLATKIQILGTIADMVETIKKLGIEDKKSKRFQQLIHLISFGFHIRHSFFKRLRLFFLIFIIISLQLLIYYF